MRECANPVENLRRIDTIGTFDDVTVIWFGPTGTTAFVSLRPMARAAPRPRLPNCSIARVYPPGRQEGPWS
ncbi:Uncharacterised protein [Mycobacteroides abscessus subsp. abscessus]|nr:Uncharacterised protein [Mycobacteroides abscessus subsp. abscessus]